MDRKNIIGLSITIVIIALGLLWGLNVLLKNSKTPIVITSGIIPTDVTKNVTIGNGRSVTTTLIQAENSLSTTPGSVSALNLDLDARTFVTDIGPTVPTALVQSLAPNFMVGFYRADIGVWQPFIILKTDSYNNALSGLAAWEPTMANDLATLINLGTNSPQPAFQSVAIENVDVRELDDASGDPILMYALPDNQTIVITTSEAALREIFARLSPQNFGIIKQ
jgi:hypothetical protein